ncbi:MAG: DNA-directed RNA polymerase subunit beta [Chitinivibrionia bacterium]|nr:DNA-directed RNA polymerase subunit beta [Chitinivibrionia bacterium]
MIERRSYAKVQDALELPDLLEIQTKSYRQFLQEDVPHHKRKIVGLHKVFLEAFPVEDNKGTYELIYEGYKLGVPKYSLKECKERGLNYAAPLKVDLSLIIKEGKDKTFKEKINNNVFIGEIPLMTERGTFVINGAERVIVSQLHRSPGIVFNEGESTSTQKKYIGARIIPQKGSWVELMLDEDNFLWASIDRKKKFPATILLRALDPEKYATDEQIFSLFNEVEKVFIESTTCPTLKGKVLAERVVNPETGEIIEDANKMISDDIIEAFKGANVKEIKILKNAEDYVSVVLRKTLEKDHTRSDENPVEKSLAYMYEILRPGQQYTSDTGKTLIERSFFDEKRYDLGEIGRYRLDARLKIETSDGCRTLQVADFIETLRYLLKIGKGDGQLDDIDHLGNRRVRSVGELMEVNFNIGVTRMLKAIRDKLNENHEEEIVPYDVINARAVSTVIQSFFNSSQLSQFLDETNPLSELTHKRRVSALGPGGLSRDRAGFEVRDVHHTHYGRLCPIETPEGPNIGLIASLSTYAQINEFGFIETPYRVVKEGKPGEVKYYSADEEDGMYIVPADTEIDTSGKIKEANNVFSRKGSDYPVVTREEIQLMDVSNMQMVSVSAGLIPYLEHDDANRALMGSNMQRQAVPLLQTDAPLVGTGLEYRAAKDSGCLVVAKNKGVVEKIDAQVIVVRKDAEAVSEEDKRLGINDVDVYELRKFERSNQDTCINQHICVKEGDKIKAGDVLADGHATSNGELALGRNVCVAYMPWNGYNYEDAIIVSEDLVANDVYTSIHIVVFETEVRETKRGPEELTCEIPNAGENQLVNLDENGVVRVGTEVVEGDILVGKVTPKGEKELSPEERLLRAIFGEKSGEVRDSSLTAPTGLKGVVIDTKIYSHKERDRKSKERDAEKIRELRDDVENKLEQLRAKLVESLTELLEGSNSTEIKELHSDETSEPLVKKGTTWTRDIIYSLWGEEIKEISLKNGFCADKEKSELCEKIVFKASNIIAYLDDRYDKDVEKVRRGDDLKPGVLQLVKVYIAKKRKLSVGDKMAGRHGNKGVVSRVVSREDMPFMPDGTPVDIILNPLGVPSRMNVGQIMEVHTGFIARNLDERVATPVFNGASSKEIMDKVREVEEKLNAKYERPYYRNGKVFLRDGKTGELFDNPVTVGPAYMLKLCHLVDDKMHARSIGPYSLVTQQPLGGKSQAGGQRFGEMEVWALEAYGAAYTLQDVLTVKSDDTVGRSKVYEAIVKGDNTPIPGTPESFNVLIREMKALAINVETNLN